MNLTHMQIAALALTTIGVIALIAVFVAMGPRDGMLTSGVAAVTFGILWLFS